MSFLPSIDIIVPTYNRPDDIKKFISEIEKQTYSNFKVFIYDDCGEIDIADIIPKNSNLIKFQRLKKNSGQAFVRNYAASQTKGDIVVFMDDDAWFVENDSLEKVVSYFFKDKNLGVLMFDIKEPQREWLGKRKKLKNLQELGNFIACGCAFSRSAFEKTSGFSSIFHSYGEETEITMQMIKNGDKVKFGEKIKVFHNYNPTERNSDWIRRFKYHSVRNDLLIVLSRFPKFLVPVYYVGKFISHLLETFNSKNNFKVQIEACFNGIYSSIRLFQETKREPLTMKEFKYWKSKRI